MHKKIAPPPQKFNGPSLSYGEGMSRNHKGDVTQLRKASRMLNIVLVNILTLAQVNDATEIKLNWAIAIVICKWHEYVNKVAHVNVASKMESYRYPNPMYYYVSEDELPQTIRLLFYKLEYQGLFVNA